jgi:hypothetical protein
MFIQSILLTAVLASPPTSPPDVAAPDFAERLASVDVTASGDDVQLVAFDRGGEPIATIAVWVDDAGAYHLESDFDDGYSSTIVVNGGERTTGTLSSAAMKDRAELIADVAAADMPQEGRKARCAARVALAGALCAPLAAAVNPLALAAGSVTCPYGIIQAWCACADVLGFTTGADVCD